MDEYFNPRMEHTMIGIIFIGDIQVCPYLDKYTNILKENNIYYEVLYWNRENKLTENTANYKSFNKKSKYTKHPVLKIVDFLEFGAWAKKVISQKKYEKLIILSTLSGIFLANTILKNYSKRYIFDIRDYSYENIKLFYKLEKKIIEHSFFTCISSSGFKNFLPKDYSYVIAHNFNYNDIQNGKKFQKKRKSSTLNIAWNGSIRYFEHQSQIINKLKNDIRFNLIYHGTGPEIDLFKNYCYEENINNVEFTGAYKNSQKYALLESADILNNSYGSKKENEIKYAIANKYYDGIIFGMPQLVEINSFKQSKVESIGIGVGLDTSDEQFADKLYEYYFNINETKFNESCAKEFQEVLNEDIIYLNNIKEFLIN